MEKGAPPEYRGQVGQHEGPHPRLVVQHAPEADAEEPGLIGVLGEDESTEIVLEQTLRPHHSHDEAHKESVRVAGHAPVQEQAVVVHVHEAPLAQLAVLRSGWRYDLMERACKLKRKS